MQTYDAQIAIWQNKIAELKKFVIRFSYSASQTEEAEDTIARLEQAIVERREWLNQQKGA